MKFYDLEPSPGRRFPGTRRRNYCSDADVVKLNEEEFQRVQEFFGTPLESKHFAAKGRPAMAGRPWA